MRLIDAYIATAAEITPDGRWFVHGGGLRIVKGIGYPSRIPSVSVVARISMSADEAVLDHSYQARVRRPDGQLEIAGPQAPMHPLPPIPGFEDEDEEFAMASSIHYLPLSMPGIYEFEILVDGIKIGAARLLAQQETRPAGSIP